GARNDSTPDDPGVYFVLPFFLIIGIYMLVGRYIVDMLVRGHTEYALTNQRAIIESGLFRRSTRSVNLAAAPEMSFNEGRNGRGTIEFGPTSPFSAVGRNWAGGSRVVSPAFENIDNADSVYAQVLSAQREAQSAR
ncbi:MAG TPA: PH domain-containing protein, partial [Sphingomicrobium sp.]|nr:PH domain-containing protein [Sphingomicrobium sp.]